MLQIEWTTQQPDVSDDATVTIVSVLEREDLHPVGAHFGPAVEQAARRARFKGKLGQAFTMTRERNGALQSIAFVGAGKSIDAKSIRTLGHDALRLAAKYGAEHVVLDVRSAIGDGDIDPTELGNLLAQGLELATYAYDRYLGEDKRRPNTVRKVTVVAASSASVESTRRGQIIASAVVRARDLVNGPADLVTPSFLAQTAEEIVSRHHDRQHVALTVLEREECQRRNMGCFLGVAQGSDTPPKFIHLSYVPGGERRRGRVCLVGKGVTFDSGGYSLKPTESMLDMKMDMAGAAAVLAAFDAIVELGLPWEVHAIVAATENMVSGRAYRLGDVLQASNGKTVEINNTDAEGRLTLADAMVYASRLEPDFILDFATLTGACMIALGPRIGGVMTPDDRLATAWLAAARATGEDMWRLPLPDDLKEQLESKIADMKNTGERWGGALTAGLFLSEFTDGKRWMHVDIAGPAMASKAYGVTTAGGTGFPVATIVELLAGHLPDA